MKTLARIGLVIAVMGVALVPTSTAVGSPCGGAEVRLKTLHVEAHPSKKKVHRGEKFKVHVTVTRPAHEDPLGNGIEFEPPMSFPAADIPVGITIFVGEHTYFWGAGTTDENGEATLDTKVPGNSEYGWAFAVATAKKYQWQVCPELVEEGYTNYIDFVKVVP